MQARSLVKVRPLVVARIVAWTVAVGAVGAVILAYDSLPDELPVSRWTSAPKSPFIALRVPLINLLTIGLIELLSPGLHRAKQFARPSAVVTVLLLTAAAKAALEAVGILLLPVSFYWTLIPLVVVLAVGLGTAAFLGREILHSQRWRQLHMSRLETAGVLVLVAGNVVLNLPIVFR